MTLPSRLRSAILLIAGAACATFLLTAGATGEFSFAKGSPLAGPHLTATDASGATSILCA